MIRTYVADPGRLRQEDAPASAMAGVVWIDLLAPSREEEAIVERSLGIEIPTREEMEEIEVSSRLYYEESAAFMTATLPSKTDTDEPLLAPVTFVLSGDRLVTIRYHEPRPFVTVPAHASRGGLGCRDGESVLIALLEAQIDRLADVLERNGREIAQISKTIFQREGKPTKSADLQSILETIGRKGDMASNILECLVSLERMFGFLNQYSQQHKNDKSSRARIKTLARDCRSLIDHAGTSTHKITFLLDATLGLINIEQNAIIKIFSVAAVVFLPPTLIASIYGMNFRILPELEWSFGYPLALLMMVVSAVLPFWYFKRKRWL